MSRRRHEGPRIHTVDVEPAMEMVDLVLQDARMPPPCLDADRFGALV
jgi:hypothetical protein